MAREALSIFVSYAHESDRHLAWVTQLANILEAQPEFHIVFDQYDLHAGKDLTHFMERGLSSDRIVVVVTREYARKARERIGGVGYESSVIAAELFENQLSDRFVPAVRDGDDRPSFLKSKVYVDFRDDKRFSAAVSDLLRALRGLAPVARPNKAGGAPMLDVRADHEVRERAPVVIATLPIPAHATEYFGPIEVENASDFDAFNVDIADVSNGSQLMRFSRIPRLRPRQKVEVAPVIDEAKETRSGFADLYRFAWVGQIGHIWHKVTDPTRVVPKEEIDIALERNFSTPVRILYMDTMSRHWVTHSELIFGRDRAGQHRLVIEFRRLERDVSEA